MNNDKVEEYSIKDLASDMTRDILQTLHSGIDVGFDWCIDLCRALALMDHTTDEQAVVLQFVANQAEAAKFDIKLMDTAE